MTLDQVAQSIDAACGCLSHLPISGFQYGFMQRAAVAIFLLAPLCAVVGLQVVNFRLAFFADAVAHSAFTGMGVGLLTAASIPALVADGERKFWFARMLMVAFGVLVALAVTRFRRTSVLSSDTIIGVFSSTAMALGIVLFSFKRISGGAKAFNDFLVGSVLTVTAVDLLVLFGFFLAALTFMAWAYNRLMLIGLNADLAEVLHVKVGRYEYLFAAFLALLTMFCIPIVGALVVTAMLVLPAASARNVARNAGAVFWWAVGVAWLSGIGGLLVADQWDFPPGATIVLCNAMCFTISQVYRSVRHI